MNTQPIVAALAAVLLASAPATAFAHGSMKPQHGGIVAMSGEILVEMVKSPKGVSFYVSEEDEPVPASGFDAKVTVTAAGKKTQTALVAAGGNRFSAPGLAAPKGSKVVVSLVNKRDQAKTFASFTTN
ncbi:MAG: hypothetical protein E2586_10160 [Novosphingobium sp.]|uniref:hypothetical protein n=1 Tax=Novosphingobium sp. TaxID=1874826 RepID=UPI0012CF55C4|nr:hypothetical protein [Novosphingobium sp.]MPS68848.1 hypothetical protein [Novosphingobium sp.]